MILVCITRFNKATIYDKFDAFNGDACLLAYINFSLELKGFLTYFSNVRCNNNFATAMFCGFENFKLLACRQP
jgi:hypothetical protein